ncbi:MAG: cytochrome b/b6 domain-containing protein [Pseudomonadota bacterium]|nr:cytochrome b/b6 domain-containing protein [Pseudomonadota bacterium]
MPKSILTSPDATIRVAIWDLPTRLFHWLLAGLIALSWWSAEYHDDDVHIWSGIAVLTLLIFRILWGFFGSSTARFASFVRGPKAVFGYLQGSWRGIGHNPLGALSVIALLAAVCIQVGLGLFASDEDGLMQGPLSRLIGFDAQETVRDLHEAMFNLLLALIAVHVAAILFYRARGKKLLKPMITGSAEVEPGLEPMKPGKWWAALACLAVAIGISRWVVAGAPPF